jgi:hypothetical protein
MIKIRNVIPVLNVGAKCGLMRLVAIRRVAYEVRRLSVNRIFHRPTVSIDSDALRLRQRWLFNAMTMNAFRRSRGQKGRES